MVVPIVHEGAESTEAYFPPGEWYNIHNGERYVGGNRHEVVNKLPNPTPVFLRDGAILF